MGGRKMNIKMNIISELSQRSLSPRDMATRLGISRLSLYFAIRKLIKDGYDIRLDGGLYTLHPSDTVTEKKLVGLLGAKSSPKTVLYDITDSTNRQARLFAEDNPDTDAIFIANGQTAGRGRLGRSFDSEKDAGLYFSLLLHPEKTLADTVSVTAYTALAVCHAIERLCPVDAEIKWVNDVYLDGKKVAGILTESRLDDKGSPSYVIIGIGINLVSRSFPDDIKNIATSLEDASGRRIDRSVLASLIIDELLGVTDPASPKHLEEYRRRSILIGKEVTVVKPSESYSATVEDIRDGYKLKLTLENGEEELLSTGEVSIRLD